MTVLLIASEVYYALYESLELMQIYFYNIHVEVTLQTLDNNCKALCLALGDTQFEPPVTDYPRLLRVFEFYR
jgi:hypothetical protein